MISVILYSLGSVIAVSLLSFLGILFFLFDEKVIRKSLLFFVSISTGALLGDVFIHIIPELAGHPDTFTRDLYILLGGILFSFVLEKIIHWRHCHVFPSAHHHHPMGLVNIFGESIHNFIDGLVIAAGFLASIPIGLSTTLAVMLHEMPHEVGNVAVLLHSGYSKKRALSFNVLSASLAIVGTVIVLVSSAMSDVLGGVMLPFAAGNLLYIAGSDLIPALHKETKFANGVGQLFCIIIGMAVMYGVKLME
jgi:zinc and cadmium transporter